jgi:hypothetical protein
MDVRHKLLYPIRHKNETFPVILASTYNSSVDSPSMSIFQLQVLVSLEMSRLHLNKKEIEKFYSKKFEKPVDWVLISRNPHARFDPDFVKAVQHFPNLFIDADKSYRINFMDRQSVYEPNVIITLPENGTEILNPIIRLKYFKK